MKVILLLIYVTIASARNISSYQGKENSTQLSARNNWPNLPYTVQINSADGEDFGTVAFDYIQADLQQQQAIALSQFSDKLVKHLLSHNDRFTAVSLIGEDRPPGFVLLELIPEGDESPIPREYYSSVLYTVTDAMRRYGFQDLRAHVVAPFTESYFSIDIMDLDGFHQWTAPIYINVRPTSDYIIQIKSFDFSLSGVRGLPPAIRRGISRAFDRPLDQAFTGLQFNVELNDYIFTVKVDPYRERPWSRPLLNRDASAAFIDWVTWFAYGIELSHGDVPMHQFDVVEAGPFSATTAIAAKGAITCQRLREVGTHANSTTGATLQNQIWTNGTVEEIS